MQLVIAPGRLKSDITEEAMLAASDRFQQEFVDGQPGVIRRVLVADDAGAYADVVFFADANAIAEVMAAEATSEVCHEFMGMWDGEAPQVYRVLQVHE